MTNLVYHPLFEYGRNVIAAYASQQRHYFICVRVPADWLAPHYFPEGNEVILLIFNLDGCVLTCYYIIDDSQNGMVPFQSVKVAAGGADTKLGGNVVVSGIGQVEEDEFPLNLLHEQV